MGVTVGGWGGGAGWWVLQDRARGHLGRVRCRALLTCTPAHLVTDARIASRHCQTPRYPKSFRRGGAKRQDAFLPPSNPLPEADLASPQGQTPSQRDGAQHGPLWVHLPAGEMLRQQQGPPRSCPAPSVQRPSVRHRTHRNRGRSRQRSPAGGQARPGRASPGAGRASPVVVLSPFPAPIWDRPLAAWPCSGHPREQSPPQPAPQEGRDGCTCLPQPHLVGMHLTLPGFLGNFSLLETPTLQKCNFLLDLPHAFERRHLTPASGRLLRAPWAFSEMSNPRRSPQHLQCFVTALAKC